MTAWPVYQLDALDRAEELEVVTVRPDGTTRRPVPIWVVRVSDDIFLRSYRGEDGAWYRHASPTVRAESGRPTWTKP